MLGFRGFVWGDHVVPAPCSHVVSRCGLLPAVDVTGCGVERLFSDERVFQCSFDAVALVDFGFWCRAIISRAALKHGRFQIMDGVEQKGLT